jgi:hypothetical protein
VVVFHLNVCLFLVWFPKELDFFTFNTSMSQFEFESLPQRAAKPAKRRAHLMSTHPPDASCTSELTSVASGISSRVAEHIESALSNAANETTVQVQNIAPQYCACRDEAAIDSLSQFEYLDHPADVQVLDYHVQNKDFLFEIL